jgi:hypothetical protein
MTTTPCQLQPGVYCEQPAAGTQLPALDRAMMIDPTLPALFLVGAFIIVAGVRKLSSIGADYTRSVTHASAAVQADARTTKAIASAGPAPRAADAAEVTSAAESLRTTVQAARSARAQAVLDDLMDRVRPAWADTRPL